MSQQEFSWRAYDTAVQEVNQEARRTAEAVANADYDTARHHARRYRKALDKFDQITAPIKGLRL